MKLTPNKYLLILILVVSYTAVAEPTPPPPPELDPPPGFPIDTNLYLLVFLGVIFTFVYVRNYIKSGKKI